jgi:hypothetical protein
MFFASAICSIVGSTLSLLEELVVVPGVVVEVTAESCAFACPAGDACSCCVASDAAFACWRSC